MGILELTKHKEMRRIFGQQELNIIKKQLLGVALSPSEKTRLSRDIRPKFKIIEELSNFKQEFNLKKAQEIKFIIEQSKEIILENNLKKNINKIFVFGSYIENNLRFGSDIDIAVEFDKIDKREASKFKINIQGKLNKKVQLTIFNFLPKKMQEEILNKGKVIYKNEQSR